MGLVATLALPDFKAWQNCGSDPGLTLDCGSILGDLPIPFAKGLKVLKLKKADDAVDAVKKAPRGCKCFLAGTDVLMSDGTTKDIERVQLGDKVQATDPETGEEGPREVTRLIVTEDDKHFNTLSVATDTGIEQLTATHEHPFWSPSESRWVEAGELQSGMTLLTDDGTTVIVTANHAFTKYARTYNLTVDDIHTYYVLAGETPILVHNSNCFEPDVNPDGSVPMPGTNGTRPLDGGPTAASVGSRIWGGSPEGVEKALSESPSSEVLRGQASLSDALRLRKFYVNADALRPQNPSAAGRVKLLQRIIDAHGHDG